MDLKRKKMEIVMRTTSVMHDDEHQGKHIKLLMKEICIELDAMDTNPRQRKTLRCIILVEKR